MKSHLSYLIALSVFLNSSYVLAQDPKKAPGAGLTISVPGLDVTIGGSLSIGNADEPAPVPTGAVTGDTPSPPNPGTPAKKKKKKKIAAGEQPGMPSLSDAPAPAQPVSPNLRTVVRRGSKLNWKYSNCKNLDLFQFECDIYADAFIVGFEAAYETLVEHQCGGILATPEEIDKKISTKYGNVSKWMYDHYLKKGAAYARTVVQNQMDAQKVCGIYVTSFTDEKDKTPQPMKQVTQRVTKNTPTGPVVTEEWVPADESGRALPQ